MSDVNRKLWNLKIPFLAFRKPSAAAYTALVAQSVVATRRARHFLISPAQFLNVRPGAKTETHSKTEFPVGD